MNEVELLIHRNYNKIRDWKFFEYICVKTLKLYSMREWRRCTIADIQFGVVQIGYL